MDGSANLTDVERTHIASRWLEYEGELRVALIRVSLVALFYAAQLVHFLFLSERSLVDQSFHRHVTYLSAIWLFLSLAVLVTLARHWLPPMLKYLVTLLDVILLVAMAGGGGGGGPASPLVLVLPLLVLLSGLRASLPLIWFATFACGLGYFALVGWSFLLGHLPPRTIEQIVVALVIGATGLAVGQLVRMMRRILTESFEPRSTEVRS